jgi:GNAT superfamily N-acetyltransferase
MAAVDATWPPAEMRQFGPWTLRRGEGGGQRVSAASTEDEGAELAPAEEAMRGWGQAPLFRLTPDQAELDRRLDEAGYAVKDPVALYAIPVAALDDGRDETVRVIRVASPLAIIDEIWNRGGIGPARRAIMERPKGPRITLMTRVGDRPAGVAFVAVDTVNGGGIAMIHAIEIAADHRRKGGGALLMHGAASWAAEQGATWLALAVTEANAPARALYERLGMAHLGGYHYRVVAA